MIKERYDKIILGAGMYGLYAAGRLAKKGCRTLVIDMESRPFQRGSYINQARLHNGYHYPRSYTTAFKSGQSVCGMRTGEGAGQRGRGVGHHGVESDG